MKGHKKKKMKNKTKTKKTTHEKKQTNKCFLWKVASRFAQ